MTNLEVFNNLNKQLFNGSTKFFDDAFETFFDKVRYFYTEYAKNENSKFYENSPLKEDIKNLLDDHWEIIGDNGSDILLVNKKMIHDSH